MCAIERIIDIYVCSILQTETCRDVGAELLSFMDRLEANPPRVARMELASGLRRLSQSCVEAVRHATGRGMPEVLIPEHSSTPVCSTRTTSPAGVPGPSTTCAPSTAAGPSAVDSTGAATPTGQQRSRQLR